MLIGNNVLGTEDFLIIFGNFLAHIGSCSVNIHMSAKHPPHFLNRKVLTNATTIVPSKFKALVLFNQILLPDFQDFIFLPTL